MYQFKVIQHNTNRNTASQHTILQEALEGKADLVCLQEPATYTQDSFFFTISHAAFHCYFYSGSKVRPRVALYVRKASNIQAIERLDLSKDLDFQILEFSFLQSLSPSLFVINLYNEAPLQGSGYTVFTIDRFLRLSFSSSLTSSPSSPPTLLLGDFNLHHPLWNSTVVDQTKIQKASKLAQWASSREAQLLVDFETIAEKGGTFYRSNLRETSVLDLAFYIGPSRAYTWEGWDYLPPTTSDHEAICFSGLSPSRQNPPESTLPRFNYAKADWEAFQKSLSGEVIGLSGRIRDANLESLGSLNQQTEELLDSLVEDLSTCFKTALEASTPYRRESSRSKPWWTADLSNQRKALARARKRYKRGLGSQPEEDWKKARNGYNDSLKQARSDHWESFLENAVTKDAYKALSYSKPYTASQIPPIQDPVSQELAIRPETQTTTFLNTLFPEPPTPSVVASSASSSGSSYPSKFPWLELTSNEVKTAIFTSSPSKSPGPDLVSFQAIQSAYSVIPEILNSLYRALFSLGYHPRPWREAVGIILKKLNKPDYSSPKAYRIISLLNCLGKVLEKLFATRLSYLANTSPNLLHTSQLGGRKQRSSIDAALSLVNYIEESRARGKRVTSTVFLDIRGAFDHVDKGILLGKIREIGLPPSLHSWVSYFLSSRNLQLFFNNYLSPIGPVNTGIPQGSPISPILFLILVSSLTQEQAFQVSYIDDFSLSTSSTSPEKNLSILKKAIQSLFQVASQLGVIFDSGKTELIHFSTSRTPPQNPLTLGGETFLPKEQVKWLGIVLDRKLSFKPHIEYRLNLAKAAFYKYRRLASTYKGLSFQNLRTLYSACINSLADYGAVLWYNRDTPNAIYRRLESLQNQALTSILGSFTGSPIKALEIEAAILPTRLRIEKLLNSYAIRILTLPPSHPIRVASLTSSRDELADSESDGFTSLAYFQKVPKNRVNSIANRLQQLVPNWHIHLTNHTWEAPWKQALQPPLDSNLELTKEQALENHKTRLQALADPLGPARGIFYTDGSQGQGPGPKKSPTNAAALCRFRIDREGLHLELTDSWNLGPYIEVCDAEEYAIYRALLDIQETAKSKTHDYSFSLPRYIIFVDSQAAILRIYRPYNQNPITNKIQGLLESLYSYGFEISIEWCPSHLGIEGNELADQLAKGALQKAPTYVATSISYIRKGAKAELLSKWCQHWESDPQRQGRHYTYIVQGTPRISYKPKISPTPITRPIQTALIQLLVGKGFFLSFLHSIGKVGDPTCTVCENRLDEPQTPAHLILRCKEFENERQKLRRKIRGPLTLISAFSHLHREALVAFLKETRISTYIGYRGEGEPSS